MRAINKPQTGSGSTAKAVEKFPPPAAPVEIDPEILAELVAAMQAPRGMTDAETEALERLIRIAQGDTGQGRRVADFLLAWWNAGSCGGFDLTTLWGVDAGIARDMAAVFGLVARLSKYPDTLGYNIQFRAIVQAWRPELED